MEDAVVDNKINIKKEVSEGPQTAGVQYHMVSLANLVVRR
jgi:hypothetical protein